MKRPKPSPYHLQAKEWLKFADYDLKVAQDNLKLGHYSYVCQLSQQAAEKYLKAFLVYHGREPKRTHILRELVSDCAKIKQELQSLMKWAKELEQYYIPTRYPVGPFGVYGKHEATQAIESAQTIISILQKHLKI